MNSIRKYTDTIVELLAVYAGVLLVSAFLYHLVEAKPFFDSLWWAGVTAMTVGYGDMYPVTVAGKVIAFVLMHLTVLFLLPLIIGRILTNMIENRDAFTHEEQEAIKKALNIR